MSPVRPSLLFVAIGLLVTGPACNSRHSPEANLADPRTTTDATTDQPADASLPLLRSSSLEVDDPSADGWTSEEFSQLAMQQLNRLGRFLCDEDDRDELTEIATASAVCSSLVPANLPQVFQDDDFEVYRGENGNDDATVRPLPMGVTDLSQKLSQLSQRHFKFKLFRVEVQKDHTTTRQYFHLSGHTATERHEYNATWTIEWRRESQVAAPKIASIRLENMEYVVAKTPNGQPLLVDCTASMMSDWPMYPKAILQSIAYWRPRIEKQYGVYNFGHHGLAVGDANGDGLDDVYVCQTGAIPNHLLIQNSDGTVRDSAQASSVDYLDNTRSALFLDLDNDADQDLIVALTSGLVILENDGRGRFSERARISSVTQAFSMAAADYDQDGLLDLYVCVYYGSRETVSNLPLPLPYFDATNGGSNHLIRNMGGWKFADVTQETGLDQDNRRFSFASAWEDIDSDGDSDLLVVNDFGPNHLYRNEDGQFEEIGRQAGLVDGAFGMSASFGDYDHDGLSDLYVSNMFSAAGNRVTFQPEFKSQVSQEVRAKFQHLARGNSLFRNLGDSRFEDVSVATGVTMGRWSWASQFVDINNDSWDDLLVTNGFITGESSDDM